MSAHPIERLTGAYIEVVVGRTAGAYTTDPDRVAEYVAELERALPVLEEAIAFYCREKARENPDDLKPDLIRCATFYVRTQTRTVCSACGKDFYRLSGESGVCCLYCGAEIKGDQL